MAISGSLRRASSNSAVIEAVVGLAAETAAVSIYRELAELPPFNPDVDTEDPPVSVTRAWASLAETLTVMSVRVVTGASITFPLRGGALNAAGIAADAELSALLNTAVEALVAAGS